MHYDNVAPCFLGGLQLIIEQNGIISQPVPAFENWYWVMAYPGIKVSTAEARAILPDSYPRHDIVNHGRYLSGFIHACHTNQPLLAATMIQDVVAEPYRTQLFAICDDKQIAENMADYLQQHYIQNDEGFVHICRLDLAGARTIG